MAVESTNSSASVHPLRRGQSVRLDKSHQPPKKEHREGPQAESQHPIDAAHKLRIVIADDEPIILLDLRQMLEELGMSVVGEASSGPFPRKRSYGGCLGNDLAWRKL
jgi:PleD family two-component response regulator